MFEKANLDHAKLIFNLRFEKLSIKNSISKKKIPYIDHLRWFRKIIKQKKEKIFIFEKDKGYLRVNCLKNKNFLSWSVNKSFRQKGYGYKMLSTFLKESRTLYYAQIKKKNIGSIKLIKKIGFKYEKKMDNDVLLFSFKNTKNKKKNI